MTTRTVHEGPNHATATWKKDFFPLFVYLFIFVIRISRFILFTFFGVFPHFSIRIRHPHVSVPRLTDTLMCDVENFKPGRNPVSYRKPRFCNRRVWMQVKVKNSRQLKRYLDESFSPRWESSRWKIVAQKKVFNGSSDVCKVFKKLF